MKIKPIAKLEVLDFLRAYDRETYDKALAYVFQLAKRFVCQKDACLWLSAFYVNTHAIRLVFYKTHGNLPKEVCAGLTNVLLRTRRGMTCKYAVDLRKMMWDNVDDVDELGDNEEYMREE